MNETLLNASAQYQRLLTLSAGMQERYTKATALKLDATSKHYRAFAEIEFRNKVFIESARYIEKLSDNLSYPDCVADASKFIMDILNSYPDFDKENHSEYLGAALKLPDCKERMEVFCNAMQVFTDYEVTSDELLFTQTVNMITCGLSLLLSVREHICSVGRK